MALSGSFTTGNLSEYSCTISFTFRWTATQSIENNQSTISWTLTTNLNPSTYSRGVRKVYITRDSTQVYTQTWVYPDNLRQVSGGTVLASGTDVVTHNADGTMSFNYNVYVNVGRSAENTWTNTATDQSVTLDTIPRASTMSLSPADPVTTSTITATVTRATDTFTHTITTAYNGSNYTLGTANFATSTSITIPAAIRTAMKSNNVASVVLPLTLTTYSGTTVIGAKEYNLSVRVPTATFSAPTSGATVACNANITWTLTDIDTTACTYTVTRSYNNTVRYTDQTKATTTTKSVANSAFETYITGSASGTITIKVTTYVGTTEVGSNTVDYVCTIPTDTYKPTLTVATQLSRVNKVSYTYRTGITFLSGYDGATGKMTEGFNNNNVTSHATIASRTVTVSGNMATASCSISGSTATINVDTFQSSNTDYSVTITYRITDTRGAYAEQSFTAITVRGYSKPVFNSYLVQRANSSGTVSNEGTYANITASASAHSVLNTSDDEVNSMSSITYKLGTVGTEETSGASVSGLNGTINKTAYGGNYLITNQYTFTMTATDYLGQSTTVSFLLTKAVVTLSLHKNNGVGLGTVAEQGYITGGLPTKGIFLYGTCATAAATAAKVVTDISQFNSSYMIRGTAVFIRFTNANGVANPTLTFKNAAGDTTLAGPTAIKRYGTTAPSTSRASSWNAGSVVCLVYDGTYWVQTGYLNSTYSEISVANVTSLTGSGTGTISGRRFKSGFDANVAGTDFKAAILDLIYPVGSVYISVNNISPATFLGGTWSRIQDTFLLSAGTTYTAGDTGGSATHTLAQANLPSQTGSLDLHGYATYGSNIYNPQGVFSTSQTTGVANLYGTTDARTYQGTTSLRNIMYNNGGQGTAVDHMPPYLVVYMWQRTA